MPPVFHHMRESMALFINRLLQPTPKQSVAVPAVSPAPIPRFGIQEASQFNQAAVDELRALLGAKYQKFLQTYFEDTEKRLQNMDYVLATGGDVQSLAAHAHSISTSSAYAGAAHLADLAGMMELKASETAVDQNVITELLRSMQASFASVRKILMEEERTGQRATSMQGKAAG